MNESLCTHYWVIDSPKGPSSEGFCKLCGQKKEFKNSFPTSGWERDGQERFSRVMSQKSNQEES